MSRAPGDGTESTATATDIGTGTALAEALRHGRRGTSAERGSPLLLRIARALLALTRGPARWMGADPRAVREIVEAKLTLDLRRGTLMQQASGRRSVGMAATCAMLLLFGSFGALALFFVHPPLWAMALVSGLTLYMLTAVLLTDYADLVLGSVDDEVLGPLPIDDRTLLVAQLTHVVVYLVLVVGSLVLPSAIVGCITQPPLAWLGTLCLVTPLAVALSLIGIVLVCQLTVRVLGPTRARQLLVSAQVFMTVSLMMMGQLPNLLRGTGAFELLLAGESRWLLLVPPLWFGGLYDLVTHGGSTLAPALAGCAVVVPLLSLFLALRLSRSRLHGAEREVSEQRAVRPGPWRRLGFRLAHTPTERAGFDLVLGLAARERGFRMRVYPMLVMPVVALVPLLRGEFPTAYVALGIYYGVVFVVAMTWQVRHTDTPEAAWLFRALPVDPPGELLVGAILALVVGFVLPWCVAVSALALLLGGPAALLDVALASAVCLAASLVSAARSLDTLPFSQRFVQSRQASQFGVAMFSMLFGVLLGGLHFGLTQVPFGRVAALALAALALAWALRRVRRLRRRLVSLP